MCALRLTVARMCRVHGVARHLQTHGQCHVGMIRLGMAHTARACGWRAVGVRVVGMACGRRAWHGRHRHGVGNKKGQTLSVCPRRACYDAMTCSSACCAATSADSSVQYPKTLSRQTSLASNTSYEYSSRDDEYHSGARAPCWHSVHMQTSFGVSIVVSLPDKRAAATWPRRMAIRRTARTRHTCVCIRVRAWHR